MSLETDDINLKNPKLPKWVLPQSTNFIDFINTELKQYKVIEVKKQTCEIQSKSGEVKKLTPTPYQLTLQKIINDTTPYRGLLLYHGLGSGKTFTSLYIAENMDRKVIVLLPASLKSRWIDEFGKLDPIRYARPPNYNSLPKEMKKKIDENINLEISKKYTFISHNAYNVADKLFSLRTKEKQKIIENGEGELDSGYVIKHIGSLDNKLLIIDEVHNLLTNIISANSKNGMRIYDMIMKAKNLKILALSGTPVVNDPYELAVLFNMLRGQIPLGKEIYTVFPDDYTKFKDYFIDQSNNIIKNKHIFQERIAGLVSYIRGSNDENLEVYPSSKFEKINIPMSLYQWKVYIKARQKEIDKEIASKSFLNLQVSALKLKKPNAQGSGDFKIASRTASNFVFPENIPKPKAMTATETITAYRKRIKETLDELTDEFLDKHLEIYSPKYKWIVDFLNKNPKGLTLIYSDFLTLEGIGILKKVLDYQGFTNYNNPNGKDYKRYAEFTGDIDDDERSKIISMYKDIDNKDGKNIKILFGTSAAAEGLDLQSVRHVILLEPYFHNNVLRQFIGRAVRRCSHINLDTKDRNVNIYLLISTKPDFKEIEDNKKLSMSFPGSDKMTTDQMLFMKALNKEKINNEFLNAMKEIAVDCELNKELNKSKKHPITCATCEGNYKNKLMYEPNIDIHIIKGNSHCIPPEKLLINQMIEINGKEYGIDQKNNLYEMNANKQYVKVGKFKDNNIVLTSTRRNLRKNK